MQNITGPPVTGDDLFGRKYELARLWEGLERGEHILMLAPRRVGKTSLMQSLRQAPREGWDVVYVDVEAGKGPEDCIAMILAELVTLSRYRKLLDTIPVLKAVGDVLKRASVSVEAGPWRAEIQAAVGRDWPDMTDRLQTRLAQAKPGNRKLLIILDELPILIARMLRSDNRKQDAELLLSKLREWRQSPEMRDHVRTLIGGSVGLEGILQRAGISGLINDLAPFRLDSWDIETATEFLKALARDTGFALENASVQQILDLLDDPVPYHVQLFFATIRDACKGDDSRVSPDVIQRCFEQRLTGSSGTVHLDHYATRLETALDPKEYAMAGEILRHTCRRMDGCPLADLQDLRDSSEETFSTVLRELEADGYLDRKDNRIRFRSNLLQTWWRKQRTEDLAP